MISLRAHVQNGVTQWGSRLADVGCGLHGSDCACASTVRMRPLACAQQHSGTLSTASNQDHTLVHTQVALIQSFTHTGRRSHTGVPHKSGHTHRSHKNRVKNITQKTDVPPRPWQRGTIPRKHPQPPPRQGPACWQYRLYCPQQQYQAVRSQKRGSRQLGCEGPPWHWAQAPTPVLRCWLVLVGVDRGR